MGLLAFLRRLLFGSPTARGAQKRRRERRRAAVRLVPLRYRARQRDANAARAAQRGVRESPQLPYRFARFGVVSGGYLDLSTDADVPQLQRMGIPVVGTPEELARWLEIPLGKLAWLACRFFENNRPQSVKESHYAYRWLKKRAGGSRLIESPKAMLKSVQVKILRDILDRIPVHPAAHGFVAGRSIVSNAHPHVNHRVIVKLDLENFYANVTFSRVVAIFRGMGYCREAAIWLARLTTAGVPTNLPFPQGDASAIVPYIRPHLPQGAPTSPALANLSAFSLDVRLSGLAASFGAEYTRYADDLTFSGPRSFLRSLCVFLPLVQAIVRDERFRTNPHKRRVIRSNRRQTVTGVVVNQKCNVSRKEFDRLKAILHNCVKLGPRSQNREQHEKFHAHLQGRIAHVMQLSRARGEKLQALFQQIRW